jgi:1-phosphofructokinase/tagatose 6-phosphate kinase
MSHHLVVCLNPTLQRTLGFGKVVAGQVNRAASNREDASGKGVNVARILHQLDEDVVHLTQAGGESGARFLSLCRADGIAVESVETTAEVRTCYTLLDRETNQTTELVEPGFSVDDKTERQVRAAYTRLLSKAHTVIISGSKAPGFSESLYPEFVAEAKAFGARVILDYRGADLTASVAHRPDVIKINVSEFAATFTDQVVSEETVVPDAVYERMTALATSGTRVVLTNGSRPVLHVEDGTVHEIAVSPVTPVNTIGCGDAVTAGIAAGLNRGQSIGEALVLGLSCAAKNAVQVKPGTLV